MRVLDFSDGFETESAPTVSGGTASQSQFLAGDGSVSAPAYTFTNDGDTGIYRIGTNNLGISIGGIVRFDLSSSALSLSNGTKLQFTTVASPSASTPTLALLPAGIVGTAQTGWINVLVSGTNRYIPYWT